MPLAQDQASPTVLVVSAGAALPDSLTASLVRLGATVIGRAYDAANAAQLAELRPGLVVAAVAPGAEQTILALAAVARDCNAFLMAFTETSDDGVLCALLDAGADATHSAAQSDHLFESRVCAGLRRTQFTAALATVPVEGAVAVRDLIVDFDRREVRRGGELIHLTASEFDLLWLFAKNAGRVLSSAAILENIGIAPGYLRMCVGGLRRKLSDLRGRGAYIVNCRGAGYMLEAAAPEVEAVEFSRPPALHAV